MPVLVDQQHAILVIDGQHGDGTRVVDVLAGDRVAGEGELVAPDVPHAPSKTRSLEVTTAGSRRSRTGLG